MNNNYQSLKLLSSDKPLVIDERHRLKFEACLKDQRLIMMRDRWFSKGNSHLTTSYHSKNDT